MNFLIKHPFKKKYGNLEGISFNMTSYSDPTWRWIFRILLNFEINIVLLSVKL